MAFAIESLGDLTPTMPNGWYWYCLVVLFGAAVGCVELIGRYKDDPFRILKTSSASLYIVVNAAAALVAYILVVAFDWSFGADAAHKALMQAFVAGFGSMVFFRSSLFSVRVGQTDVSVGPAVLFQVLLFATDRQCDRERAGPRSDLVADIMRGVSFQQARQALPSYCFELMQNVPANEQQQFRLVVDALAASSTMRDDIKALNLGLMLMNVVGGQVLAVAVRALGPKIQGPAQLELQVYAGLQAADFGKAYPLLANLCFIMSAYGTDKEQEAARTAVLGKIDEATKTSSLDNSSKMTFLGLLLQQYVGDAVLLAALTHVKDAIALPQKQSQPNLKPGADGSPDTSSKPDLPGKPDDTINPADARSPNEPAQTDKTAGADLSLVHSEPQDAAGGIKP